MAETITSSGITGADSPATPPEASTDTPRSEWTGGGQIDATPELIAAIIARSGMTGEEINERYYPTGLNRDGDARGYGPAPDLNTYSPSRDALPLGEAISALDLAVTKEGFIDAKALSEMNPRALADNNRRIAANIPGEGDDAEKIAALQEHLKAAGYDVGPIDGKFGGQSKAALEAWTKDNPGAPIHTLMGTEENSASPHAPELARLGGDGDWYAELPRDANGQVLLGQTIPQSGNEAATTNPQNPFAAIDLSGVRGEVTQLAALNPQDLGGRSTAPEGENAGVPQVIGPNQNYIG